MFQSILPHLPSKAIATVVYREWLKENNRALHYLQLLRLPPSRCLFMIGLSYTAQYVGNWSIEDRIRLLHVYIVPYLPSFKIMSIARKPEFKVLNLITEKHYEEYVQEKIFSEVSHFKVLR